LPALQEKLDKIIKKFPVVKGASVSGQYLSNKTKEVFDKAQKEADDLGDEYISSEHILLAILQVQSESSAS
jgi:ATP-dependent Clp protease ATP-binding subunit ClpB